MINVIQLISLVQLLWPRELQHARLTCPSPSFWVCSDSCSLGQWCHPTISSSIVPFSTCPQSFPESGSFPMNQFFASGDQSIGVSVSALPSNIQAWFPLGLTGDSQESSPTPQFESINSLVFSLYSPTLTSVHNYWKNHSFEYMDFAGKMMSLLFNTLLVCHSYSFKEQVSFNFMAAGTVCLHFEAQENEIWHCCHIFPIYLPWSDRTRCHDLKWD